MAHPRSLFPTDAKADEWLQFAAAGFTKPACGFIRRRANPATFGMPLGAAMGMNLAEFSAPGGLVDRMMKAARVRA